jgi:hypothetical protein
MVARGGGHDLHQPRARARHHGGAEGRFLNVCASTSAGSTCQPLAGVHWGWEARWQGWPCRRWARYRPSTIAWRAGPDRAPDATAADIARLANARLMAQHIVGQSILADFGQRHGGADIGVVAQQLPVGGGKIGGGVGAGQFQPHCSAAIMP